MSSEIRNLSVAAERLRTVRKAQEKFLAAWALEFMWGETADRAAVHVERIREIESMDDDQSARRAA